MIRNCLSNVDTLIKEHFQGKGRLLVKLLVGQALLIGVLTFFCLTRPGGEDIQAQANLVVDQDAIRNADGDIKVTAEVIIAPANPTLIRRSPTMSLATSSTTNSSLSQFSWSVSVASSSTSSLDLFCWPSIWSSS